MLVDVFSKGITGKVAEAALGKAGITVNKNAIPFDTNPPMVASGIRIGTPAVTTRGMREAGDGHDRRAHRPRARRRPDDDARARHGPGRGRGAVPEVPAVPGRVEPRPVRARPASAPPSTRSSRPAARSRVALPASSRAPASSTMAAAVARRRSSDGGVLLAEAGTGTGKTLAYLVPAILSRAARPDLDRHQEPPGTDLLQGHPVAARRARRPVHRHLHEGARRTTCACIASSRLERRRPAHRRTRDDVDRCIDA